ncbi:YbjN domain-containing protein [Lewinella sp. JB7]|nr:YbjN domain-containing protein [Lewinella sp. JB7]
MSIWDNLFGRKATPRSGGEPEHRFGRYTDAHKSRENYAAWDQALDAFEEGDFIDSCTAFMAYLRDEREDNVKWQREADRVYFELYQGSKRVTGVADREQLRATARIARLEEENAQLLRRLTDMNYELKYSRFALDEEDCLTIIFDTPVHDASPHKLYHALKEMALRADKQDDLLLEEFGSILSPVEVTHLEPISAPEKQLKLDFLRERIQGVIDYLASSRINPEEQPGAVAYLLLDLVYRLDYLLIPEGHTMEALERMHRMYFAREEDQAVTYKNVRLLGELQHLLLRAPESFAEELYAGKSTFGITLPASHDRLGSLIANELPNMDWYQDNGYPEVARAIPGYIAGYALFNYATPPPDRDLLHLYYRITEDDYFRRLGYRQEFLDREGRPARRAIRAAITDIVEHHRREYPRLRPGLSHLDFASLSDFSRTYLEMVRELDLGK